MVGAVRFDQKSLKRLLSNEFSLMVKTQDVILRLNPLLQTHTGRHD